MPPKPMTPNRKVRCLETGKFYVSVQHRSHARYRRYIRTKTEYGLALNQIGADMARMPDSRRRASRRTKKQHRDDPSLRLKMSRAMRERWRHKDYNETMVQMNRDMNTQACRNMQSCINKERTMMRKGKLAIRFERGERERTVGVVTE